MPEAPITNACFILPLVSHVVFFAAIASGRFGRDIVIPIYMLVTFGLVFGLSWFEGARLGPFLKRWYPGEFEKLQTRSGYGYNSFRGLRFAFFRVAEDDYTLVLITTSFW